MANIFVIFASPTTYSYALVHHTSYTNSTGIRWWKWQSGSVNKSKTNVMIVNNTPIYVNNTRIKNIESDISLGQRYSTRDKNQDKGIQRRVRPDGQHSPSTVTSSRVTLGHVWRDKSTTHAHFQQWDTAQKHHKPSKEQASRRTNKDGKEYIKHHILGQKNKHLGWISQKTEVDLGRAC